MKIFNSIQIATQALKKSKLRTSLTILGVVIGIASVTMIISAGNSFKEIIYDMVDSFGPNYINAEVRVPQSGGGAISQVQGVVITTMTEDDRQEILKLPYVDKAYAGITAQEIVSWQGQAEKAMIYGLSADFIDIDSMEIAEGRFYTNDEDDSLARVVVLGSKVKDQLFGSNDAIGRSVKINKMNFKVVGVAEPRGSILFFDMDDIVYMPIKTTQKMLLGIDYVMQIVAQVDSPDREEQAVDAIRGILREQHGITNPDRDDFEVMGAKEARELMDTIIGAITLLLVALAAVSLVVGGVGIMNIMYATVAERTFEIGLRKAVGASKRSIMMQFLSEAIVVTFIGGVVGIILGLGFTYLVAFVASYYGIDWPFSVSILGIVISITFSVAVGLIFGLYPAKKAANLEPITALRKD